MKLFLLTFFLGSRLFAGEICADWFKSLFIVTPSGCETYCALSKTDMSTFVCKSQCAELCKKFVPPNTSLSILDPVINSSEQALSKKNPKKAIQAYVLSYKAESICSEFFTDSLSDDESDACRHFFWSYLMAQKIDSLFAQDVLKAHENDPFQSDESKKMDEANNAVALNAFKEHPSLDEADLKKLFIKNLKDKKFLVIQPNPKNWKGSHEMV